MVIASVAPGQPTPTIPSGAYGFKDLGGNLIVYYPPTDAPVPVTWQTYRDAQHGYHLEIPGNWTQMTQSPTLSGARMVCPPGADTQLDGPGAPACVNYGWVPTFTLPSPTDPTVTGLRTISAGAVSGYLFSESTIGSVVTAVFPKEGGDVVISAFANSDALLYAFQHMVATLTFS